MGCWNEFDPFTHTPIYYHDEVVMVLLAERGEFTNWWLGSLFDIPRDIENVYKGTYNDYGWIEEQPFDIEIRPDSRSIFFHRSTWDAIIAKYKPAEDVPLIPLMWEDRPMPEFMHELQTVMEFGNHCKLHLSAGLAYKGAQSHYKSDRKQYHFLQKLVAAGLARMDEQYVENGGTLDEEVD